MSASVLVMKPSELDLLRRDIRLDKGSDLGDATAFSISTMMGMRVMASPFMNVPIDRRIDSAAWTGRVKNLAYARAWFWIKRVRIKFYLKDF